MEKDTIAIASFLLFLAVIVFASQYTDLTPEKEVECVDKSDCVPASCCHATECVPKEKAPDCSGVVCTMECRPGTMDCGQGYCDCINNTCKAVIEEA